METQYSSALVYKFSFQPDTALPFARPCSARSCFTTHPKINHFRHWKVSLSSRRGYFSTFFFRNSEYFEERWHLLRCGLTFNLSEKINELMVNLKKKIAIELQRGRKSCTLTRNFGISAMPFNQLTGVTIEKRKTANSSTGLFVHPPSRDFVERS